MRLRLRAKSTTAKATASLQIADVGYVSRLTWLFRKINYTLYQGAYPDNSKKAFAQAD